MTIVDFLNKVKEAFPDSDPTEMWRRAEEDISNGFCSVPLVEGGVCSLQKSGGVCPYHKDRETDFIRRCNFVTSNGAMCHNSLKTRDLKELWCTYHLNMPKSNFRLMRVGDYIVIKDTPYAISDDMLSIIGRVEATYVLSFVLRREKDSFMEEVAKEHGLTIRLDD